MFCKYRDILGKVNNGIHSYRLLNLAIIDVIMTIMSGYIIAKVIDKKFINVTINLFLLGIILHRIFCVNTTINKMIFGFV